MNAPRLLLLFLISAPFVPPSFAGIGDGLDRPGLWWFDACIGYGSVTIDAGSEHESTGLFHMSVAGGRVVTEQLWLGIETAGWLYEASNLNDPDEGDGYSTLFATCRIVPVVDRPWHISLGGGYASHWSNHADESRQSGYGWSAGLGYDFAPTRRSAAVLRLSASGSDLGDENLRAVTLSLGWRWR